MLLRLFIQLGSSSDISMTIHQCEITIVVHEFNITTQDVCDVNIVYCIKYASGILYNKHDFTHTYLTMHFTWEAWNCYDVDVHFFV